MLPRAGLPRAVVDALPARLALVLDLGDATRVRLLLRALASLAAAGVVEGACFVAQGAALVGSAGASALVPPRGKLGHVGFVCA
jgi:hypothetical protein